jgi:hypothetical protein
MPIKESKSKYLAAKEHVCLDTSLPSPFSASLYLAKPLKFIIIWMMAVVIS